MPVALTQPTLNSPLSPSLCAGRKLDDVDKALLMSLLQENPQCPSRLLLDKVAQSHVPLDISVRHLNRLRRGWELGRLKGRPRSTPGHRPTAASAEIVRVQPRLLDVGVHLFEHWLDQHRAFDPVVAQLQQAIQAHQQAHPDDDFAFCITVMLPCGDGFRLCFLPPSWASTDSPSSIPTSIPWPHYSVAVIKARL